MASTVEEQKTELQREMGLRKSLYPGWVKSKKMSQAKAERCISRLADAINTLNDLKCFGAIRKTNFDSDGGVAPASVEIEFGGRLYTFRRED